MALGGYWLEDSQPANAWRIPEGVVVQPGGCLTVWASSTHPSGINADGSLTAPFGLGKSGDAVALLVPDRSRELDRVVFGTQSADISQGRWPNGAAGTWNGFTQPTPGLPNRNPAFSAGLLPGFAVQTVQAGAPLAVSCVTTAAVSGAVYAVAEGPDSAAINSAGLFTWTPPPEQGSGVYAFRITLMGLSGFGDLVLTCTSLQSRNFRYGIALGSGSAFDPGVTVEGAATARAVTRLAQGHGIEMPIAAMIAALCAQQISVSDAVTALLSRPLKEE